MTSDTKDLTSGNITRKLMLLSLPIMLSNFMQTLYNLTDTFWLGKTGPLAKNSISVIGMAFPIVFFISSFGFGFVISGTSLISQYKGANDLNKIKEITGQFVIIFIFFASFFLLFSHFFLDYILQVLNTPPEILESARSYISIILIGMIFMIFFMIYQSFSHGLGDTYTPMKIQVISVVLNLVLDPLMIFGLLFFPKMDIVGAALATLISRVVAVILSLFYFRKTKELIPSFKQMIPNFKILKQIFNISIPASMAQSMTSFGFLILQGFVNSYGTVVIAIYSIGNRLTSFYMMPAMGLSNALSSFIGQNLGANKIKRAEDGIKTSLKITMIIMVSGGLILFLFGNIFIQFFINDAEIIAEGSRMLKITSTASALFGIFFIFNGVFNGSGYTKPTMFINISRLWIFRLPLTYLLSGYILNFTFFNNSFFQKIVSVVAVPLKEHPYDALWWAMLISNLITGIMMYRLYKKGQWKKGVIYEPNSKSKKF